MATYLPPTQTTAIFDPLNFLDTGNEALTYNEAKKSFVTYPNAQGAETLQSTTVNGTLDVYGVSTFNDEAIIQTSHGQTALQTLRIKDTVSNQSMVFNPNAVNNTYNGIVEASDAVITTSNNANGLVLTNTNSTTTNGIRIATNRTTIGNGGGGTDIPTNNITFQATGASAPIVITSTAPVSCNRGLILGTASLGNGLIQIPTAGGSFQADFSSSNNFRFVTFTPTANTSIWVTPTAGWLPSPQLPANAVRSQTTYYNGSDTALSANLQIGIDSNSAFIKTEFNGASTPVPLSLFIQNTRCITLDTTGGITLNTATTANANIQFANAGSKLKYFSGVAGQVPISDATGLLTLGTPTPTLSFVNGSLPANGSSLAYVPAGQYVTYASISLTAGTWNVRGLAGISPANNTTVNTIIIGFGTNTNAIPNIYSVRQYYNTLTSAGANAQVTPIETIITVASTTTYHLIMWVSYSGAPAWSVPSTGGQQLFAIRIA